MSTTIHFIIVYPVAVSSCYEGVKAPNTIRYSVLCRSRANCCEQKRQTCLRSFDYVRVKMYQSMEVNDDNTSLVGSQRVITKLRGQTVIDSDFFGSTD